MKADPIVLRGADILGEKLKDTPKKLFGTKELAHIVKRMSASLRTTPHGVAIAANQIGLDHRIFVVRGFVMDGMNRTDEGADDVPDAAFINPKIKKRSRKKEKMEEACLSVPGYHGIILRSPRATVVASDETGERFERGATGLLAQIFQHECDHLDGILYVEKAEEVFEDEIEDDDEAKK